MPNASGASPCSGHSPSASHSRPRRQGSCCLRRPIRTHVHELAIVEIDHDDVIDAVLDVLLGDAVIAGRIPGIHTVKA